MQDSKDDPKAGADVGKIVNLMAVDASKVPHCLIQRDTHLLTNVVECRWRKWYQGHISFMEVPGLIVK